MGFARFGSGVRCCLSSLSGQLNGSFKAPRTCHQVVEGLSSSMRAILSSAPQTVQYFASTKEYVRCILLAFGLPAFEGVVFVVLAVEGRPAPLRRAVPFLGGIIVV